MPIINTPEEFLTSLRALELGEFVADKPQSKADVKTISEFVFAVADFLEHVVMNAQKKSGYALLNIGPRSIPGDDKHLAITEAIILPLMRANNSATDEDLNKLTLLVDRYLTIPFEQRQIPAEYYQNIRLLLANIDCDLDRMVNQQQKIRSELKRISKRAGRHKHTANSDNKVQNLLRQLVDNEKILTRHDNSEMALDIIRAGFIVNKDKSVADIESEIRKANQEIHNKLRTRLTGELVKKAQDELSAVLDCMLDYGHLPSLAERNAEYVKLEQSFQVGFTNFCADEALYDDKVYVDSFAFVSALDASLQPVADLYELMIVEKINSWMSLALVTNGFQVNALANGDDLAPFVHKPYVDSYQAFSRSLTKLQQSTRVLTTVGNELEQFLQARINAQTQQSILPAKDVANITRAADWFNATVVTLKQIDKVSDLLQEDQLDTMLDQVRQQGAVHLQTLNKEVHCHRNYFMKLLNFFVKMFTCGHQHIQTSAEKQINQTMNDNQENIITQQQNRLVGLFAPH